MKFKKISDKNLMFIEELIKLNIAIEEDTLCEGWDKDISTPIIQSKDVVRLIYPSVPFNSDIWDYIYVTFMEPSKQTHVPTKPYYHDLDKIKKPTTDFGKTMIEVPLNVFKKKFYEIQNSKNGDNPTKKEMLDAFENDASAIETIIKFYVDSSITSGVGYDYWAHDYFDMKEMWIKRFFDKFVTFDCDWDDYITRRTNGVEPKGPVNRYSSNSYFDKITNY